MNSTKMVYLISLALIVFSSLTFAKKILIKGPPVHLDLNGTYYDFPPNYTTVNKNYHFVILGKVKRICYLSLKPGLGALDRISIIIEIKEQKLPWHCYAYNSQFFEVDY